MPRQSGFSVLSLLLLAVALLASLAFVLIGAGPNIRGQLNAQRTAQLVAQAQFIVHRIVKCATDYPLGSNSTVYPVGSGVAAETLTCPGNNDQNLWSGVDGVYFPSPITGFGSWTYTRASPTTISIVTPEPSAHSASLAAAAVRIGPAAAATATTLTVKVVD